MYRVNDFIQKIVKKAGEENKTDVSKFWKNVGEDQQLLVRVSLELIVAGIDESIINVVDIDKFIEKDIATLRFSNPEQIFDFVSKSFGEEIKEKLKAGGTPSSEIASSTRRRRSVAESPQGPAESNTGDTGNTVVPPTPESVEETYDGKKLSEYTESDFDASSAYYDFDHPTGNGILATLYADADKPFSLDAEHTFLMMEDESKKVKLVKVPAINTVFTEEVHTEGGQDILIRPQDRYVEGEERDVVYLDKSGVEGATLFKDLLYGLALGSMSNLKPATEELPASGGSESTPTPTVPAPEAAPEEEPADANVGSSNPSGKVITVTFKGGEYCLIDGKAKKKIKVRGSSPEGPVDLGDLAIPSATIKGEMIGHGYQVRNGYWNVESTDGTINKMCSDYELMYLQNVNSNLTITPVLEATGGGDHL